ncbi:MAG: prepilin-type N-terminal cleavage/methylation domain-containing protein [Candidatus Atribacteria bacterium]|nr:prepilin-type N-terminal cleavage/methylation domain-containing protein [Candidatus Atribacteria bacterium]
MIHSSNCNKGYTLIELMVIVTIISLLLGLGINGISSLIQWNKLNTVAALLSSELKSAQSRAFYEGVYYKIEFYPTFDCPNLNKYKIYKESELYKEVKLKGVELFKTKFLNNQVYFYPSGVPGQGGTVTLKNRKGKILYVIMTPVTARIRISPEPPENW